MSLKNNIRSSFQPPELQAISRLKYPEPSNPPTNKSQPPQNNLSNNNTSSLSSKDKPSLSIIHQNHPPKKPSEVSTESSDCHNGESDDKSLRAELQETKSKMKTITTKLSGLRKERDQLQKENKTLQEEILALQASMRHMIPGFANTSSSFPMLNELINNVAEFYKCECEDIFFDLLSPELSMKGIIYFFRTSIQRVTALVEGYFKPSEDLLKQTGCLKELEGPLMNSMRKSYQANWREILDKCIVEKVLREITSDIQGNLKLRNEDEETKERIEEFLQKMGELFLCFYISDPPLKLKPEEIGNKVLFNPLKHEPLDGFIKAKDECIVILPSVQKNSVDGELVSKALVLQTGYEMLN